MIPVAQIPAAAIASLLLRGNLWIAAVSTLISNPLTYAPLYFFAYRLGARIIDAPVPAAIEAETAQAAPMAVIDSVAQAWSWLSGIGQPLLLGMSIMAVSAAILGYGVHIVWRLRVRHKRRAALRNRRLLARMAGLGST